VSTFAVTRTAQEGSKLPDTPSGDWIIVVATLSLSFAAAVWLADVFMVATTFSTDTPKLVTNFLREGGVAANWAW
jgi:hypothetical protein